MSGSDILPRVTMIPRPEVKIEKFLTSSLNLSHIAGFRLGDLEQDYALEDLQSGRFSFPENIQAVSVTVDHVPAIIFDGKKWLNAEDSHTHYMLFVKNKNLFSIDQAREKFGENSKVCQDMTEQNASYVVLEEGPYSGNRSVYAGEVTGFDGENGHYKQVVNNRVEKNTKLMTVLIGCAPL